MKDILIKNLKKISINIKDDKINKILQYWKLLLEKNKNLNLISSKQTNEEKVIIHLVDSLSVMLLDLNEDLNVLDFGSGGGLPAIPLKIVNDSWNIELVESKNKKCIFLQELVDKLNLENIKITNKFLNNFNQEILVKYDLIMARAVSELKNLFTFAARFLNVNGYFLAMKGPNWLQEYDNAKKELKKYNLILEKIITLTLPEINAERALLLFKKIK